MFASAGWCPKRPSLSPIDGFLSFFGVIAVTKILHYRRTFLHGSARRAFVGAVGIIALLAIPGGADAAASSSPSIEVPPPAEPKAIPIRVNEKPSASPEQWFSMGRQTSVRNVSYPTITPFLPDPSKATGAAVLVFPGGGFISLSMDNEGWPVARWLADHGIAAFVVKYRLRATPRDQSGFFRSLGEMLSAARSGTLANDADATQDALDALNLVRSNAAHWNVDPARIGLLGFSAGAMTVMQASLQAPAPPSFMGYIYGPMTEGEVTNNAPPMFAAIAADDSLFGAKGFAIVEDWQRAHRPVEFHLFEKGSHGFGMGRPGTTSTLVLDEFLAWLNSRGILGKR